MITQIYWVIRVIGYIVCLVGIFLFLAHQADADPALKNTGLGIVGAGFVAFFISYALRVWLRYASRRTAAEEK